MATVLIGEDEPDVCLALKLIMTRAGHRVLTTADGATALDMAKRWKPDLMILDLGMPHMTGLEVCQALRNDPATAETPIMIVSAWGFNCDLEAGNSVGADDYIVKPFNNDELLSRATALLSGGRQPGESEMTLVALRKGKPAKSGSARSESAMTHADPVTSTES